MLINNNQWVTIVLITAVLMLVFLIFVFYGKKSDQLPEETPPLRVEQVVPPTPVTPTSSNSTRS